MARTGVRIDARIVDKAIPGRRDVLASGFGCRHLGDDDAVQEMGDIATVFREGQVDHVERLVVAADSRHAACP